MAATFAATRVNGAFQIASKRSGVRVVNSSRQKMPVREAA